MMYTFNETIIKHLTESDPVMAFLIKEIPLNDRHGSNQDALSGLISIVISQQLALSVASKLNDAFTHAFKPITKKNLANYSADDFKKLGLSRAKSETIKRIIESPINFDALKMAPNETIFDTLTHIKGLGPWSAEMFILFIKGDQNFFSFNDGGIKNALKTFFSGRDYQTLAQAFDPYKSYACLVLWEALAHKKTLLKKLEESTHELFR